MKILKINKRAWSFITASALIAVVSISGYLILNGSHANGPYANSEAEGGTLSGVAGLKSDSSTSGGSYVKFSESTMLGALDATDSVSSLYSTGFRETVIKATWASVEPSRSVFSSSAISSIQSQITAAKAAGLSVSLDIGMQYSPSWIFTVGAGTQFVDQFGDVFTGTSSSGNYVPNAITDISVRTQLGAYLSYLGSHLTNVDSVRLGGAAFNELRYPSGKSGSSPNAYWFYDSSSQASLLADVQGWKPGTGSVAQATEFLNAYNSAIVGYGIWLEQTSATAFSSNPRLEILLPGWGDRPSSIPTIFDGTSYSCSGLPSKVVEPLPLSRPSINLIVVDLPAPFGPKKPVTLEFSTSKDMSLTAAVFE